MNMLFVSDLDGTLLTSGIELDSYTTEKLNRFIRDGVLITYSTARSYYTASMLLQAVDFCLPCITYNGAYIVDAGTNRILRKNVLNPDVFDDLIELAMSLKIKPFVFGKTSSGEEVLLHGVADNSAQQQFLTERINRKDRRLRFQEDMRYKPPEIITINYLYPDDYIMNLETILRQRYKEAISIKRTKDIYNEGFSTLEISDKEAEKGTMLRFIANLLTIDMHNVTVFGDQLNDLSMFIVSGTSVAVENADSQLKQIADHVTFSNDNDGVVKYIEDFLCRCSPPLEDSLDSH